MLLKYKLKIPGNPGIFSFRSKVFFDTIIEINQKK